MFSLGIVRPQDYPPHGWLIRVVTGNRLSLRLLRTGRVDAFEAIMRGQRLTAGIYRTTFPGRFRSIDPVIGDVLTARYPAEAPLVIHDWAASDCLTSAEWAMSVLGTFPNAMVTASDLTLYFLEIALADGTAFITERTGGLLQYVSGPFVVDLNALDKTRDLITKVLARYARNKFGRLSAMAEIPHAWLDSPETELALPRFTVRKLPAVHPVALALARRDERFRVESHSVFSPLARPADVIRSMNIYNRSYFDEVRLREGVRAVWRSLKTGGLWVVGRTWREEPPATNMSLLEKTESGFRLILRHGEGSEIEGLMLTENAASFPEQ